MRNSWLSLLASIVLVLYACGDARKEQVAETLKMMQSSCIAIPVDSFVCYEGLREVTYDKTHIPEYKLVVYVDSNSCTSCTLSNMHVWDDYVRLSEANKGKFAPLFIFAPAKDRVKHTKLKILAENFRHPIFIDTAYAFSRQNPNIPKDDAYHVFLLDDRDSVLLVGDPTLNKSIGESLQRYLKHILGAKSLAR